MKKLIIVLIATLLYGCGDLTPENAAKNFADELGVEYIKGDNLYHISIPPTVEFSTRAIIEELYPGAEIDGTTGFRTIKLVTNEHEISILSTQTKDGTRRLTFSEGGFNLNIFEDEEELTELWPLDIINAKVFMDALKDYGVVSLYYSPEIIDNQLKIKFLPVNDTRLRVFLLEVIENKHPRIAIAGPIIGNMPYQEQIEKIGGRNRYMADMAINDLGDLPNYEGNFAMVEQTNYFHYLILN